MSTSSFDTINREKTTERLKKLPSTDVRWLVEATSRELTRRIMDRARIRAGFQGLANVMAGVTWALACRASLRAYKGHSPIGKGLASGEMWMPWEMVATVRHEVKERGWSPLGQQTASAVLGHLQREADRKVPQENVLVNFQVRMAEGGARVVRDAYPGRQLGY